MEVKAFAPGFGAFCGVVALFRPKLITLSSSPYRRVTTNASKSLIEEDWHKEKGSSSGRNAQQDSGSRRFNSFVGVSFDFEEYKPLV